MNREGGREIDDDVRQALQQQPYLLFRLAENALTVADSLRNNYFANTALFISHLRRAIRRSSETPILRLDRVQEAAWRDLSGEVVTFIDGGVGTVEISSQVPILLRVGSYAVRTGERRISE